MAFIRVGEHYFRKSKIACIDVSSAGLFGHCYRLSVIYDRPDGLAPTREYEIYYDKTATDMLLRDMGKITFANTDCLLNSGARRMLGIHNKE